MTGMQSGDRERLEVLLTQAAAARRDARSEDARPALEEAVAICRKAGVEPWLERALAGLGQIERDLGNLDAALSHYGEAAEICRRLDNPQRLAHTVRHMADIHLDAGNLVEAGPCYDEALAIYRAEDRPRLGDFANALRGSALLRERLGEREAAKQAWAEAGALYAEIGVQPGVEESVKRIARLSD